MRASSNLKFFVVVLAFFLSASAGGATGTPSQPLTAEHMKSLEVILQIYQTVLAVIGATLAFLLYEGKAISSILRKSECVCGFKFSLLASSALLICGGLLILWDMATISNQLRNDFYNPDHLINDDLLAGVVLAGIILFIVTVLLIWKENIRPRQR